MKAIIYTQYGPPNTVRLEEVPKPAPADNEVLVEVHAASVVYSDLAFVKGKPFLVRMIGSGLLRPKYNTPGVSIAGRVESTGKNVTRFRPGDEVFGDLSLCGRGGFAECVRAPEDALAPKPVNVTFEQAAAVPQAAVVALQGLRKGNIQAGNKVLINGASGGIGSFAVQIAKAFGAEVTGVCSTRNVELVQSLGADYVIDYTKDDFVRNGRGYDLILATAGYRSIFDYRRALAPGGSYVMTGGAMGQVFQAMLGPFFSTRTKKMTNLAMKPDMNDLIFMKELIEAGKVVPVIDRSYPLGEVAKALQYYGEKHARGIVTIGVKQDG
jgi:NADPH:quinone reductase-like Zn-dependent oxidoreductase